MGMAAMSVRQALCLQMQRATWHRAGHRAGTGHTVGEVTGTQHYSIQWDLCLEVLGRDIEPPKGGGNQKTFGPFWLQESCKISF